MNLGIELQELRLVLSLESTSRSQRTRLKRQTSGLRVYCQELVQTM